MEKNDARVYEGRPKSRMVVRPFVTSVSAVARPVIAARPSEGAFSHFLTLVKRQRFGLFVRVKVVLSLRNLNLNPLH